MKHHPSVLFRGGASFDRRRVQGGLPPRCPGNPKGDGHAPPAVGLGAKPQYNSIAFDSSFFLALLSYCLINNERLIAKPITTIIFLTAGAPRRRAKSAQ